MTIPGSDRTDGASPAPRGNGDASIRRASGVLWRAGDFGVVVLGIHRPDPLTLAGTGVDIWNALDHPLRRDELIDRLAERFGADPTEVARDVAPVVDDLLAGGVLEVVP